MKSSTRNALILLSFTLLALLLYFPVLNNAFLSDDYDSLYRILVEKRVIYKEYLRPLTDVAFYFNYLLSGLNPASYYWFNIAVHVLSSFMVYKIALQYKMYPERQQIRFAVISGLLFLLYPFHSEPIFWLTARISSLACLAALMAIYWSLKYDNSWFYVYVGLVCFIVGLLGYESIIILPVIILVLNWYSTASKKELLKVFVMWMAVAFLFIIARHFISGNIINHYNERMWKTDTIREYVFRVLKTVMRLFVAPQESERGIILYSLIAGAMVFVAHLFMLKNTNTGKEQKRKYFYIVLALVISMILPMTFGISTKTSEGDRLLYFPSVFLCMGVTFIVFSLFSNVRLQLSLIILLLAYFVSPITVSIKTWESASKSANGLLQVLSAHKTENIVLLNVPEDIRGAYVFRNGLKKAITLNGLDTNKINIINYYKGNELDNGNKPYYFKKDNNASIYPGLNIAFDLNSITISEQGTNKIVKLQPTDKIFYWDKISYQFLKVTR